MVFGYVRVSTNTQDENNQKLEIQRWANINNVAVDNFCMETISSMKKDRAIYSLIKSLNGGDILIISELSRLGRSLTDILSITDELFSKKVRIVFLKENWDLNENNPMSKFAISIFGAFAELERNINSQRTKEAIKSKQEQGIKVGRPEGSKNKTNPLDSKKAEIEKMLAAKVSKSSIAKILGVHRDTLSSYLKNANISK